MHSVFKRPQRIDLKKLLPAFAAASRRKLSEWNSSADPLQDEVSRDEVFREPKMEKELGHEDAQETKHSGHVQNTSAH